jgi:hypothetical protein
MTHTYTTQYQKILAAPNALCDLLEDTNFFNKVLRGFPENINTYKGNIATVYFKSLDFSETMGLRNRPDFLNSVIGLISKGSKTSVHDNIINNSLYVLSHFSNEPDQLEENRDWVTLKGNVRNTEITGFNIYPERTGKSLITTSIIQLKHDVRYRM